MKLLRTTLVLAGLLASACGGSEDATVLAPEDDPGRGVPPGTTGAEDTPDDPEDAIADLRADTNRDGVIRFDDPSDDAGEDVWDENHGAIFLANIDDDEEKCPKVGSDVELPKCHDAADDVLNGADDLLDLARLKTKPWAEAPAGAAATLTWTASERVRLFKVRGTTATVVESGAKLSLDELRAGIELGLEARDIVRDSTAWDGYVDVTFTIDASGTKQSDEVRLRVAPLLTSHHLSPAEATYVSLTGTAGNAAMREDLATAATAAGVAEPRTITTQDQWTQDFFETGFMSMPAAGDKQHVIRVSMRSANASNPLSLSNPLRRAGRVVFTQMRGKDAAAVQEFDPTRRGRFDTLNSFGNFETIPPYTHAGQSYPLGRVLRGSTPEYYPDKAFQRMIDAQKIQPSVLIDTSWLLVGHVDETTSFVKAPLSVTPRGWVLLANDPTLAKSMLESQQSAGNGGVAMFVGKSWGSNRSAQATIDQVLVDTDVMGASAEAAVEVDAQLAVLKAETGLTDAEIVRVPFLHMPSRGASIAYQPGMVNGIYIADGHFVAPDPHGPQIEGQDIFKVAMVNALAPLGITVHFAEDWDGYHRALGEVHCGTNAARKVPDAKWWESGR